MAESANIIIAAKKLTKTFFGRKVVNNVSFSVEKGEIMGFLGPNAAGKTTTMKMLTCFYPPTSGTAVINGYDILKDSEGVRRSIGYMPENVPLYDDLKVSEYLYFAAKAKGVHPADIKKRIADALDKCNLLDVSNQIIATVSRGYKQRVGLAQSIINNPPILILDEPSVGLDPAQIKDFRDLILGLAKSSTVILSTHILPEVSLMCNRVCIIDKGSIVAVDTPSNLSERIQKSAALKLQIVAAVSDEVAKEISRLKSITRVEKFGGERVAGYKLPLLSFKIECSKDQAAARREVCSLLAEKGWELYSMTEDRLSLEDVFINLVNDHKAASEISEDKAEASESSADGASEQNKPDDASLNKIEE